VQSDAEFETALLRCIQIPLVHPSLHLNGARQSIHNTWKLYEHPVTCQFHHASVMLGNFRLDNVDSNAVERCERTSLVNTHEPAVTHHIRGNNSS
jgi:hypothetical protein